VFGAAALTVRVRDSGHDQVRRFDLRRLAGYNGSPTDKAVSLKKILLVVAGVGFLALFGYRLYSELGAGAQAGRRGEDATRVSVTAARTASIREMVVAVGSLRAQERVDVTPRVGGRLIERLVDLGDAVREGQLIARLDDDEIHQQVQQAEASLNVSRALVEQRQAELQNTRIVLERARGLVETQLISAQDFEAAQTRYDVAVSQVALSSAQVNQASAGLEELRIRLDQTHVMAPISGVVGRRFVDVGAMVNANTPIVTLINLDNVILVANIPERELTKLSVGNPARVTVDAIAEGEFRGEVVRISPLLDPQTRTGEVEIQIANPDNVLKAQMFARAMLDLPSVRTALLVPRQGIVYRGDRAGVYLVADDTARFQPVETGLTQGDDVEVISGLVDGQIIVTEGSNLLRDGDPIQIDSPMTEGGGAP
jgi:RND family efflux transporter MFP subunit